MSSARKKTAAAVSPVVVRLPKKMVLALDKAAEANCRTRSSEVRIRLQQTLGRGAA